MTRLYFTLDYLGYGDNTFILNGGIPEWKSAGGTTSTEITKRKPGSFSIKPNKYLLADLDYVKENLNNPKVNIVDGRAAVFYQGIEAGNGGKSRKGHIVGAKTIPYTSLYQSGDHSAIKFLEKGGMEAIFNSQELDKNQQILLYCHIGLQLTTVYVAAKILGYRDLKVYDASFYEWGPDESLPIELTD